MAKESQKATILRLQEEVNNKSFELTMEKRRVVDALTAARTAREEATQARKNVMTSWIESVAHLNRAIAEVVREGGDR